MSTNTMSELMSLVEHEIPEARQSLLDNFSNLEKVAEYCETNYFRAENKQLALKETKDYATQSLASVAYQINTLAYNLLHMLDLQGNQLGEMESQINNIAQTIAIHKEKVARREIGILTTNKCIVSQHKILVPANPERPAKYQRKPIDYSILDDIGHGVKIVTTTPRTKRISQQSGIYGETGLGISGSAPTSKPPNPPTSTLSRHGGSGIGSLSRGSKEYRTPVPVIAPPQVPSNYAPNYPQGHPRAADSRRGSGYSTLPLSMAHQPGGGHVAAALQQMHPASASQLPGGNNSTIIANGSHSSSQPQIGMVHPITQPNNITGSTSNFVAPSSTPPPPLPPPPSHHELSSSPDKLPPPPFHQQQIVAQNVSNGNENIDIHSGNVSPPLPSPPAMDEPIYNHGAPPSDVDWVPKEYIEKVVAIYDYVASRHDELSFQENSVIYVIKKNEDGWYEGVMNGITGLFPGNYVEGCR